MFFVLIFVLCMLFLCAAMPLYDVLFQLREAPKCFCLDTVLDIGLRTGRLSLSNNPFVCTYLLLVLIKF